MGNNNYYREIAHTFPRLKTGALFATLLFEYRYDNSTGAQGGFYGAGGIDGPLVNGQSTVFVAMLFNYDGKFK